VALELTRLDEILRKFNRDQDSSWLLIRSRVQHWNRIAELSRKTPRIPVQRHYSDDYALCTTQNLGMANRYIFWVALALSRIHDPGSDPCTLEKRSQTALFIMIFRTMVKHFIEIR